MNTLEYPKTINLFEWSQFLNRDLTQEERNLLTSVRLEEKMNQYIDLINNNINLRGLEVSNLSVIDGNCLFDSLAILNIGNNHEELRKAITHLLYMFKDYENFFPDQKETLSQLFMAFNEIELVHCRADSKIYKYSYEIMCQDLYESCNWTRLPTQLILMFISKLFNLNITIIQDSGFEHSINQGDEHATSIYLAHLGESHYMPINKIIDGTPKVVHYENCKREFFKWANHWAFKKFCEKMEQKKQENKPDTNSYSNIDIGDTL